jgi:hypothetical protein
MHARLAMLRRLMVLYGGIEEIHSLRLQQTMVAVVETEKAIDVQQKALHSCSSHSRDALITGDRMQWASARTQRELAEWKHERLEQIRIEREKLNDVARKQYIASRLQHEQMKHVVGDVETAMETEAERRMQGLLDDRFLARRRWIDARKELRAAAKMNIF